MNQMQKASWYTLAVVFLAVTAYLILSLFIGLKAARPAFGLIGLVGLSTLYYKKRKGEVLADERDGEISRKAMQAGFFMVMLYAIPAFLAISFWPDFKDYIPRHIFSSFVVIGVIIFFGTQAIVTLLLYRADTPEPGAILDFFRNLTNIQKGSLIRLVISASIITVFIIVYPLKSGNTVESLVSSFTGGFICLFFGIVFLQMKKAYRNYDMDEREEKVVERASRLATMGWAIALVSGLFLLGILYFLGQAEWITVNCLLYVIFLSFAAGMITQHVAIFILPFKSE